MKLGLFEEGEETEHFEPIPGQGLWWDEENKGHWRRVLIYRYDHERNIYEGVWDGTTEKCELTRINLLFDAEDPRIFAQRVAKAHQDRIYADSQIRYNFFIDNMPTNELPELDSEQISRIISMSLDSKYLRSKGQIDTNPILNEVNLDYARTMNKIIFDKSMEDPQDKELIETDLTMPPQ